MTEHVQPATATILPVQYDVLTAHGPQLNPIDFLIMFSSLRLLPAHTNVMGSVTDGSSSSSSMLRVTGRSTRPLISILKEGG